MTMKISVLLFHVILATSLLSTHVRGIDPKAGNSPCEVAFLQMISPLTVTNIEMFDYTGKAINDMGNYDGCISLPSDVAHYCVLETILSIQMANEQLPAYMGMCAPATCSPSDLEALVTEILNNPQWNISSRFNLGPELKAFTANCDVGHETKIYPGMVATVTLIIVITLLVITGTYLETQQAKVEAREKSVSINGTPEVSPLLVESTEDMEAPRRNTDDLNTSNPVRSFVLPLSHRTSRSKFGKLKEVLKCFGLRTNTKFLFADNRASEPHLACLNGLRTIMMAWVVLGHTFTYMTAPVGFDNLMTIKQLVSRVSFQVVPAAELSVDVFFYLSGFLVAYMVVKEMKAKHGRIPWFLFYFHRYWRLTPVYGFVIMVYTTITPYLIRGPFHYLYRESKTDLCEKYWWTNLLYINNFYPHSSDQQCLGWSWYLANDMQFYIFTPFILLIYYKNKRAGWVVVSLLITVCMILNTVLSYQYDLVPLDPNNNKFNSIIYNKPYTRMGPYLVGILAAFLLQEDLDLTSKKWIRWAGYLIAATITSSATYLTVGFWRHGWNLLQDVMYMTYARIGFVLAVAWVMYSFHKNHGGIIREVLSLYIWVPLARLTYSVYLVHPIVIFVINYSSTTTFHYSAIYGTVRYSSNLIIAYIVGLLFHLFIEKPTANLERVFLPRKPHNHK